MNGGFLEPVAAVAVLAVTVLLRLTVAVTLLLLLLGRLTTLSLAHLLH